MHSPVFPFSLILICLYFSFSFSARAEALTAPTNGDLKVTAAVGEGQTTGHIATITVKNKGKVPIYLGPQTVFIPSDGKHQSYVGRTPGIVIQAGATVDIPVYGYCTDVHKPPVGDGDDMPPIDTWIPVGQGDLQPDPGGLQPTSLFDKDPLPAFNPGDVPGITSTPGFTKTPDPQAPPIAGYTPSWPGTDIPIGGTIDPSKDPEAFAPVIVRVVELIEQATTIIQTDPEMTTPFSRDPEGEREAIIQQTIWIYMGAATGDPHEKSDFATTVYDQFSATTGIPVTKLPEDQKEQLDAGVTDFWNVFMATGVEAKVLREPEQDVEVPVSQPETTQPPVEEAQPDMEEERSGCSSDHSLELNPPYELDMEIAEEFADEEERQEMIDNVREALASEVQLDPDGSFTGYDINRHPTSSTAFWKAGNVGGFASAYAKTWFQRADGSWDWVWGTDRMETNADGTMQNTLSYQHDESCRAMVTGTALIRMRASSSAFDAMAGNSHLENDTEQLNFLRGTKYAGKLAIDWLIARGRGRTNQTFRQHVQDDLRSQVEGQITEAIENEVQELAEQYLSGFLGQIGLSAEDISAASFEMPDLIGMLEEEFGINIPTLEDLDNFLSEGTESFFNLFFVSNTYATANGSLTVHVGGNTGSVLAHTSVHYSRESSEETQDAMQWSGEQCREELISDAQPDALTIRTSGFSNMVAEAASRFGFGNGQAEAFLESMDLQVLAGICICGAESTGEESTYEFEVMGTLGWYTADEGYQRALEDSMEPFLQEIEDGLAEDLGAMSANEVNELTENQFEEMLASRVRAWGEANKFAWGHCNGTTDGE